MSKFVEFQVAVSGKRVFINPDQVTHVTDHDNGKANVILSNNVQVEINGNLQDVANKLST